jgi:N-dimethylarginine dimethylaminohydrolase
MEGQIGQVDPDVALRQWTEFYHALKRTAEVHLIEPQSHVPDLVFTANSGLMIEGHYIPSRFKHEERRREEPIFREWFETRAARTTRLPKNLFFEGAGDALVQPGRNLLWAGYGFRTDRESHQFLADQLKLEVLSLRLIDPRFYHLDTCFCPLLKDQVMYYPRAFDKGSLKIIEARVRPENRIIVPEEDAIHFTCNAVLADQMLFLNHASPETVQLIEQKGYKPIIQPVFEFLKAGGANKCLTLALT